MTARPAFDWSNLVDTLYGSSVAKKIAVEEKG
jgi:hypothetical protein